MTLREIFGRLAAWRRRDTLDRELSDELREHLELLAADLEKNGLSPAEACAAARRQLGNLTQAREASREAWGFPILDHFIQDVRYALRGIARAPGFAAAVILTLGLGIGANAAMFGIVDRLLFRPYPLMQAPGEVHRLYLRFGDGRQSYTNSYMPYTRYLDLRRWTTTFEEMAAVTSMQFAVGEGLDTHDRQVGLVSAEFFSFFDAPPALGRYFTPEEDGPRNGASVVVLAHDFWQREFGGADVLGRVLRIGDLSLEVIGVTPRGLLGLDETDPPVAYLPITTYADGQPSDDYFQNYSWSWFEMMARRKPGVTVEQASADLAQAYTRSYEAQLALNPQLSPVAIANPEGIAAPMRPGAGPEPSLEARTALWVTGVAVVVLLIACANVANLFLARALRRQRETAVRVALGVGRGRLARQMLTEGLVLALLGAVAGLFVAQWGGAGVRALLVGGDTTRLVGAVLTDTRTLAVSGVVALLTGLLTALVPALLAGRTDTAAALKAGAREGAFQRSKARTTLLLAQFALSFVLLAGAGLFVRSLQKVETMRVGFDADRLLVVNRVIRGVRLDAAASRALTQRLLETTQAFPGVEAAAAVSSVPFTSTSAVGISVPGIDSVHRFGRFTYQVSTPDYFRTAGTQILRGRALDERDQLGAPLVVVVGEGMAQTLWPGQDALGQCLKIGADTMPCRTVVGIAENITQQSLTEAEYQYYLPAKQFANARPNTIYVRFQGDPAAQQEALRRALQPLLPGESYLRMIPMADRMRTQQASWRLGATMFVAFGLLALVVAGVGLYGVIGYTVTQRLHEMGVRIAFGAQGKDILGLVVGQSLRFALVGIGTGVVIALVAARWIEPLLFRQPARDPLIFAGVGIVLLLVTLAASAAPAWRAIKADPASALRVE